MEKPLITQNEKYTLYTFKSLPSTNTYLKEHCEYFPVFTVIRAVEQQAGRGRFSRTWLSAPGKDLTFSLLLPLSAIEIELWPNIPQITALAIAEILDEYGLKASVKWPNDVLINGKKIAGILCETQKRKKQPCAVLGIGININSTPKTLSEIPLPATSLFVESGKTVSCDTLLEKLLLKLTAFFETLGEEGFAAFYDKILRRLAFRDEEKTVLDGTKKYTGKIRDLNPDGTLELELADGSMVTLLAGEISFSDG